MSGSAGFVVKGNRSISISFTSAVDPDTASALQEAISDAANQGYDDIHLFLSTPGGYGTGRNSSP